MKEIIAPENSVVKNCFTTELNSKTLAYLSELAADIAAHGGAVEETIEKAIVDAHARRQKFARELLLCKTRRVRMAKKAIEKSVWTKANAEAYSKQFMSECGEIDSPA